LKRFEGEEKVEDKLDNVTDTQFGSYVELIKINKFKYKNPRKQ
jgi:FO synthase subunit 2